MIFKCLQTFSTKIPMSYTILQYEINNSETNKALLIEPKGKNKEF